MQLAVHVVARVARPVRYDRGMRIAIAGVLCLAAMPARADKTMVVERVGVDGATRSLPETATVDQVRDVLVTSRWLHFHPDKRVSVWESRSFEFRATEVVVKTPTVGRPPLETTYKWSIVHAAKKPVIRIDSRDFTLARCPGAADDRHLCIEGPWL